MLFDSELNLNVKSQIFHGKVSLKLIDKQNTKRRGGKASVKPNPLTNYKMQTHTE